MTEEEIGKYKAMGMEPRSDDPVITLGSQKADGRTWITVEYDAKAIAIDLDRLLELGIAVEISEADIAQG